MKRNAFGAIDLLIGLLLISTVFIISMKSFKGINFQGNPQNVKSIQQEVDTRVNEIELMRQKSIDSQREMLE